MIAASDMIWLTDIIFMLISPKMPLFLKIVWHNLQKRNMYC